MIMKMRNMMKRKNGQKGFTLVELIVVMAILAVLAAIAVPRFGGILEDSKDKADTANKQMILKALALYQVNESKTDEEIIALDDAVDTMVTAGYLQEAPVTPDDPKKVYTCDPTAITGGKYTVTWGAK